MGKLLQNSKILVVDDMEKWHEVAKANLNHYGFANLSKAYTLEEGRKIYTVKNPELIITDINFDPKNPGDPINNRGNLEGLILAKEIKITDPTKLVIIMSSIEDGAREAAKAVGADYFIQKQQFRGEFDKLMQQWK